MLTLVPAIQRAMHAIETFLEADATFPLTQSESQVIAYLLANGDSTVGQIHREFGHKRSTLTSILNRLEDRSAITCRVNGSDRRSLLIGLTPLGETFAQTAMEKLAALEEEVLAAFSPRDRKNALWMLTAVKTVVEREIGTT